MPIDLAPVPDWLIPLMSNPQKLHQEAPHTQVSSGVAPTVTRQVGTDENYAKSAFDSECQIVSTARTGTRNDILNKAAFKLSQFFSQGLLNAETVRIALVVAATQNGLVADEGMASVQATIESGFAAGQQNPRDIQGANNKSLVTGGRNKTQHQQVNEWPEPTDPFAEINTSKFPTHFLPPVLRNFVEATSHTMGGDAGGLALSCLVTCAASIPDRFTVQVQRNNPSWTESARLWGAVSGPPSSKKTPTINAAILPLKQANADVMRQYQNEVELAEAEDRKPVPPRQLIVQDSTVEALAVAMQANPDGILKYHDELTGFIGAMEKYSGGKGAAADRAIYLETWNGGSMQVNRIARGLSYVENGSMSLIGGIQPGVAKKLFSQTSDDGFLARFIYANLVQSEFGVDEPVDEAISQDYSALINHLITTDNPLRSIKTDRRHQFDDEAQATVEGFRRYCHELERCDAYSTRFAGWAGKLSSQVSRVILTLHYVKNAGETVPHLIANDTCLAAIGMFKEYFIPHAIKFFIETIGGGDGLDDVQFIAKTILTRGLEKVSFRDLTRANRHRFNDDTERRRAMHSLESFGWISPENDFPSNKTWYVNPRVHMIYTEYAARFKEINRQGQMQIMKAVGHV